MSLPEMIKPIPAQVINEQAAYGPFDLNQFVRAADDSKVFFQAELANGAALPQGLICTSDGILTGIPAKGTSSNYDIVINAKTQAGTIETRFIFVIKPSITVTDKQYFDQLKSQIWEALEHRLPIPEFSEWYDRAITPQDIYFILERWGLLKVWDTFNLDPPGELKLLTLPGVSAEYQVYDRGSCIIACPKDLFSENRTLADGLQTAKAVAREVYKRNWTIEMVGFDKLQKAAWVELQLLGDLYQRHIEIINFMPSTEDIAIYRAQIPGKGLTGFGPEK